MKSSVIDFLNDLNPRRFTNNTQKALYKLLTSSDGWVKLSELRVPSPASRIRDLRKEKFGGFEINCRSAAELDKRGDQHTFYYKINQRNLTVGKVRRVFNNQ